MDTHERSHTRAFHACAAVAAIALAAAGCQPQDPYQETTQLPTSTESQPAVEAVTQGDGRSAEGSVAGASSQLPLDERAAAETNEWSDTTRADYDRAIADCEAAGEALRQDCIEQVRAGFRAAQIDAANPEELRRVDERGQRNPAGAQQDDSASAAGGDG